RRGTDDVPSDLFARSAPLDHRTAKSCGSRHCPRHPSLLASRIAPFGDCAQGLAGEGTRGLKVERWVGAERVLARSAAAAIAHRPAAGAGRLYDQVQARQVAIGNLLPSKTGLDGLDSADGEDARHRVAPARVTAG